MKHIDVIRLILMLVGLAAAPSAFAVGNPQVYDVRLVLRTTVAQSDTLSNFDNAFLCNTDKEYVVYRESQTITWHGLIWGSGCNAIDGVWEQTDEVPASDFPAVKGCVIWDTKTKKPVYFGNGSNLVDLDTVPGMGFGWNFINAIDKNGQKCEGAWTMVQEGNICEDTEWEEEGAVLFCFHGAGFGTLRLFTTDDAVDCTSHVDSIAGDLTGYLKAPYMIRGDGCSLCGGDVSCDPADAWEYCGCKDFADIEKTAACGTWVIKYNPLYSYQYGKATSILETDCFADLPLVAAKIESIENCIFGIDPTGCDELEHALALAKQNTYAAERALAAVSYENLKAAEVKAAAELAAAEAAKAAADTAYEFASEVYAIANGKYETAVYNQTNVHATIIYKNASGDPATVTATGCAKITAAINEFEIYTLVKMETQIPGLPGVRTSTTWAECKAVVAEFETATVNAKADLVKAEQNKAEKYEAQATAAVNLVKAQDAYTAAANDLGNINLLQYKAAQQLDKAEAALAAAQKAYDDNCCGGSPHDDPPDCDELEHALALAKQNTYAAEQAVEAVKYENLKAAEVKAAAELAAAEAAKAAADTAYEFAAEAYTIANGKYETAVYNQTNVHATIIYKNASGDPMTITGKGAAELLVKIETFEMFTLVMVETSTPSTGLIEIWDTWAGAKTYAQGLITTAADAKANLEKAEQNKAEKYEAQATAAVNLVKAQDAYTAAQNDLGNITILQYMAQMQLEKAEAAEAVAQKAYDDSRCGE